MQVDLAPGWRTELDRGPDWLFVRLYGPDGEDAEAAGLADSLVVLLQEELTRRMVLELDQLEELSEDFVEELIQLHELLESNGGLLRLCGLSRAHQEALRALDSHCRLPHYRDREEAVMGFYRPGKPR